MSMPTQSPTYMSILTPTPISTSTSTSVIPMTSILTAPLLIYNNVNSNVKDIAKFVHLNLFSKREEVQKYAVKTYYDANAVFENPILLVESHDRIINQFFLLSALFYSITSEIQSVTNSEVAGNHHLVCIDALIKYRLPIPIPCLRLIFRKNNKYCNNEITLRVFSKFEFNEQQKIVRHEDVWSVKDLVESLPIVGFLYVRIARKLTGMITSYAVITVKELVHTWEELNVC